MAVAVYILCTLTALLCAVLLLRGYRRTGIRLLLWAGICFVGLTLNNAAVVADLVIFKDIDLRVLRNLIAIGSLLTMLYGLIFDVD